MPRYAKRREQVIAAICDRVILNGDSLTRLCRRPDMPSMQTLMKWQREDPALKRRLAQARAMGQGVHFELTHPHRWRVDPVLANELIERVAKGESLQKLVLLPGWPNRRELPGWRRMDPDFSQRLDAAMRAGEAYRKLFRRGKPLGLQFDEALGDRFLIRVGRGETIPQVLADPQMPGEAALARYRRRNPDFDAAVGFYVRRGRSARKKGKTGCTPVLTETIEHMIIHGASLTAVTETPGMPSERTFYRWIKNNPDFAKAIDRACDFRDWMIAEQAGMAVAADGSKDGWRAAHKLTSRLGSLMRGKGR